jgi:hypothetical protein
MRHGNCLVTATTPSRSTKPIRSDRAETAWLHALAFYLFYEAPENEHNFSQVSRNASLPKRGKNDEERFSALDMLFDALERE